MESLDQPHESLSAFPNSMNLTNLAKAYNISKEHCHINKEQTVLELLTSNATITKHTTKKETEEMISRLTSKVVLSINEPTSLYQIESISFDKNPNNTVIVHNKTSYTLLNYYAAKHNVSIKFKTQPLLIAKLLSKQKQTKSVYLLPEVSYIVTLDINNLFSPYPKRSNRKASSIKEDKSNEEDDEDKIQLKDFFNKYIEVNVNAKAEEEEIFTVAHNPNEIKEYINKKREILSELKKSQWLIFFDKNTKVKTNTFKENLIDLGNRLGIKVEEPVMFGANYNQKHSDLCRSICGELEALANKKGFSFNMIVIILPNKDCYHQIKKFCIENLGIMTQIVIAKKIRDACQYYGGLLMQMYQKTGSDVFRIQFSKEEKGMMICGITLKEVISDSESSESCIQEKGISFSIAASYNDYYTKYHFEHITDTNSKSFEEKLSAVLSHCIEIYYTMNYYYPSSYVLYLHNAPSLKSNTLITQVSYMIQKYFSDFQSENRGKQAEYFILEVDCFKKDTNKSNEFFIMKGNKQSASYCLLHSYSNVPLLSLYHLTLKLTYYNWLKVSSIPCCLRYAQKGNKMFDNCKLTSIKERIKNEPFYL